MAFMFFGVFLPSHVAWCLSPVLYLSLSLDIVSDCVSSGALFFSCLSSGCVSSGALLSFSDSSGCASPRVSGCAPGIVSSCFSGCVFFGALFPSCVSSGPVSSCISGCLSGRVSVGLHLVQCSSFVCHKAVFYLVL